MTVVTEHAGNVRHDVRQPAQYVLLCCAGRQLILFASALSVSSALVRAGSNFTFIVEASVIPTST